jgi:hypothetical protein
MAFLKIKTLYVIGNDNSKHPQTTLEKTATNAANTTATTVDLFIFGTAEPATSIMAASIPMLRALIRPERQPHPVELIELDDKHRKRQQSSALEPLDNHAAKEVAKDSWS